MSSACFADSGEASSFKERSMQEMLRSLDVGEPGGAFHAYDGWRHPLPSGNGFRHDYDVDVARGSWEFHQLGPGFCVAIADFQAAARIARVHRMREQLVLSVTLQGDIIIDDAWGCASGKMARGYCTYYGMHGDAELHTIYEPGHPLKWVSIFIDRCRFFEVTGLQVSDLRGKLRDFVLDGGNLAPRSVLLSHVAALAATGIMECPYREGFKRTFLRAKALEIVCEALFASVGGADEEGLGAASLDNSDYDRVRLAMQRLRGDFGTQLSIGGIAEGAGLTRQKLQLGFRVLYGDTVARVRDRLRMEHALHLVRETSTPMIEIALDAGYEHAASFTRAFKAAYGVAPIRMRRMALDARRIREIAMRRD